jgi:long-chain acyl-CoA synthetase
MNLFSILEDCAKRWPEDIAVAHDGRSWRYRDLYSAAESLALKLLNAGMRPGCKIGLMCPETSEYITVCFAIWRAGGIVVPISHAFKAAEVGDLADEIALDAFCYGARLSSLIPGDEGDTRIEASIFSNRSPLCIKLARARNTPPRERERLIELHTASLRFTSGTTSQAKGLILSHETILQRIGAKREAVPTAKGDSFLYLLPMGRSFPTRILGCLSEGTKIVTASATNLAEIMDYIKRHAVEEVHATPLFYRLMVSEKSITAADLIGVKYFTSGGSSLPNAVAAAFRDRFGREVVQRYSLGECGLIFANFSEDVSRRGAVGRLAPGYEARLASASADRAGKSDVGELLVRGPGMFDAYYKPWRLREEVLEDGWFRTGDLARRDADGYYCIVGRVKDLINVGGVKVFPSEIEDVLLSHPAVEEAVVFSVPEARFGEVPHGKVKLRAGIECTAKEILQFANKKLSVFKTLRAVEFVDEISKTVTGKPRRVSG